MYKAFRIISRLYFSQFEGYNTFRNARRDHCHKDSAQLFHSERSGKKIGGMIMGRNLIICSFAVIISFALSVGAFSMGGTPPEEDVFATGGAPLSTKTTAAPAPAPTTQAPSAQPAEVKSNDELGKARDEIIQLQQDSEQVEKYMWWLDGKIIEARRVKNTKKLVELKELEQDTLARARAISEKMDKIIAKYPQLKGYQGKKATQVQQGAKMPIQPAAAMPKQAVKPQAVKPQVPAGKMVYHYVVMGDTLMNISRQYFGTPAYYKDIAAMNGLADPSDLKQGMVIKVDLTLKGRAPAAPPVPTNPGL